MAVIPEFYIMAVTAIGVRLDNNIKWIGTGFFIYKTITPKGDICLMLVTNKHIFKDKSSIVLRLKEKGSESFNTIDIPLVKNNKKLYKEHPKENIDIAVMHIHANVFLDNNWGFAAFNIDEHMMTSDELRNEGVDEESLVHMLGFPFGLVNISSTLPICRLGCVARISSAQIKESHNILIDIQNFSGNSGSPIVTRPEITKIVNTKSLNKSVLLGIVHSYIPYHESLVNVNTGEVVEIRSENSGIALVHPVEFIKEVVDEVIKPFA